MLEAQIPAELEEGLLKNGYSILDIKKAKLGEGEQGIVILATRTSVDKKFAIKITSPKEDAFTKEEIDRFSEEVSCMALMPFDRNVISVVDQFSINNQYLCYVMDFIDSQDLREHLYELKTFDDPRGPDKFVDIVMQITRGLGAIHKAGVVHRDLKESNVLIVKDSFGGYQAIITDFGFGYSYTEDEKPRALPGKESSYARHAIQLGISGAGLDYFCLSFLIDNCIANIPEFAKSQLLNPLKHFSKSLKDHSTDITDPNDALKIDVELQSTLAELRRRSLIYRVDPEYARLLAVRELTDVGDGEVIRLSGEVNVPLTKRVLAIIDTPDFQRLRYIMQLADVQLVYPGGTHSRFEHSLGTFNYGRLILRRLLASEAFTKGINKQDVEKFLLSCLLHDIGHVPHCHALEEIGIYNHELNAKKMILRAEIAELIARDWSVSSEDVTNFISTKWHKRPTDQVLKEILEASINIDTMDYLYRDSAHVGVPYGKAFDIQRLLFSMTINDDGDSLAITHKGIVAAETYLIARYAMYSQVYLHSTVRAVTAMLQRAIWEKLQRANDVEYKLINENLRKWDSGELNLYKYIAGEDKNSPEYKILGLLSDYKRVLYKKFMQVPDRYYRELQDLSYGDRVNFIKHVSADIKRKTGIEDINDLSFLLDIPPDKFQEIEFDVYYKKTDSWDKFKNVSPLLKSLEDGFKKGMRTGYIYISDYSLKDKIFKILKPDTFDQEISAIFRDCIGTIKLQNTY